MVSRDWNFSDILIADTDEDFRLEVVYTAQLAGFRGHTPTGAEAFLRRWMISKEFAESNLRFIATNDTAKRAIVAYAEDSGPILNAARKDHPPDFWVKNQGRWLALVRREMDRVFPDETVSNETFFKTVSLIDMHESIQNLFYSPRLPRLRDAVRLYRAQVNLRPWGDGIKSGDELVLESITSTSITPLFGFMNKPDDAPHCCMFIIEVPAGFPILYISHDAHEVLLPRGTVWVVSRIVQNQPITPSYLEPPEPTTAKLVFVICLSVARFAA